MRTAIFAAAFDSQLKWASHVKREFETEGFVCKIVVPDIRSALSDDQIADAGEADVHRVSWSDMIELAFSSDVFVSALSGPLTKRISIELHTKSQELGINPPLLVGGWVGVIIEKLVAGYLDRAGCDIIAVNSKEDWDRFADVASQLKLPITNMTMTGLPFIPNRIAPQRSGPIRTVLFADQPTIPEAPWERRYLYERLIAYAKRHSDRRVLLKPRHRPGEDTFHRMKHHPEDLIKDVDKPVNFSIDYTPISEMLSEVDLLMTVSSTAALEAIAAGCAVGLILDGGVHEKYGNVSFLHSGLLRTFDQLEADEIGAAEQEWLTAFFPQLERRAGRIIVDRALELMDRGEYPSHAVRFSPYFRSAGQFHHTTSNLRDEIKAKSFKGRGANSFSQRLDSYGPIKRQIVKIGDALLPPIIAKPVDIALRKFGIL